MALHLRNDGRPNTEYFTVLSTAQQMFMYQCTICPFNCVAGLDNLVYLNVPNCSVLSKVTIFPDTDWPCQLLQYEKQHQLLQ